MSSSEAQIKVPTLAEKHEQIREVRKGWASVVESNEEAANDLKFLVGVYERQTKYNVPPFEQSLEWKILLGKELTGEEVPNPVYATYALAIALDMARKYRNVAGIK